MSRSASLAFLLAAGLPAATPGQTPSTPSSQAIDSTWLSVDADTKTATFQLVAGLTGLNGALNFNGFRDGGLTLTVPQGWQVLLQFSNHDGVLPHSAEVIADVRPVPPGPIDPAFDRAATLRLSEGLQSGAEDDIRFLASKAGSYLIFCAVPGHGAAGMWIRLRVSDTAARPGLSTTPAGGS